MNVRKILGYCDSYLKINREERNLAAIFYHCLLINDNLNLFLNNIGYNLPIVKSELAIYFEYAFLRDLWNNIGKDNIKKKELILQFLDTGHNEKLKDMSEMEFNAWFGAVPKPSVSDIQSPGNWSIPKFNSNSDLKDKEVFLKICKFKWCFNAKPDIVIHTSNDTAICIEAKLTSGEGHYPASSAEKKIFKERGLEPVGQLKIQQMMMEDLLGIKTKFVYLTKEKSAKIKANNHKIMTWKEVFNELDLSGSPDFIKDWIKLKLKKSKNDKRIFNYSK